MTAVGSLRPLLAVGALFLGGFAWLRGSSDFLALEADAPATAAVARAHGVPLADALALRELVGLAAPAPHWQGVVQRYADARPRLGDQLAAIAATTASVAIAEQAAAARAAAPDAEAAWAAFRVQPEAIDGLRFVSVRSRFASRASARG